MPAHGPTTLARTVDLGAVTITKLPYLRPPPDPVTARPRGGDGWNAPYFYGGGELRAFAFERGFNARFEFPRFH
jgi:hypothetical protein